MFEVHAYMGQMVRENMNNIMLPASMWWVFLS
jgi:hypothetical protein